ncbi:hypothetical protein ABZ832_22020 [Streptantibioticus parmotrematis]|uniref:hypothetical protein n=1 Tax=Streptantibioticus parmotrematis TaxID=2873249 RepID=UPI00340250CB
MPENTPVHAHARVRRCGGCDGFPVVAIDAGTLNPDGTRTTLTVTCPACRGTGAAPARPVVLAGR